MESAPGDLEQEEVEHRRQAVGVRGAHAARDRRELPGTAGAHPRALRPLEGQAGEAEGACLREPLSGLGAVRRLFLETA
eukprot:1057714-Alexandrium_andersonii.AAC.1